MIQLLVPAEESQVERFRGQQNAYDRLLRPRLMVEPLRTAKSRRRTGRLKVEGLDSREDCQKLVAVSRKMFDGHACTA
jgi:hypothetical protein